MIVGSNIGTLMQQVMAMKSPELIAILPDVEKMPFDARVAMVRRGHENLCTVIKNWDKFSEILAVQRSLSKSEIKGQAKGLKNVRSKLEMALRLADPKIIPAPFRSQAEAAFNVVAAWFLLNQGYMDEIYTRPRLTRQDVAGLNLPPVEAPASAMSPGLPAALEIADEFFDGPAVADLGGHAATLAPVDMMDATGQSAVY